MRCAKIGSKFWNDFTDFITDDLKMCFAVDAMLIFNMSYSKDLKAIKSVADVLEMLALDKKLLRKTASIAKAIITQNLSALLDIVESTDTLNYTPFLCYFHGENWNFIMNSVSAAKMLGGKVIIAGALEENTNETINLDKFGAIYLYFYHCTFKRTCGIVASTVQSEFVNCIFQDNFVPEYKSICSKYSIEEFIEEPTKGGIIRELGEKVVFLDLTNARLTASQFINCRALKNLISLTNGTISNCKFTDCQIIDWPQSFFSDCTEYYGLDLKIDLSGSYLMLLSLSIVTGCSFTRCKISTQNHAATRPTGGLVYLKGTELSRSKFYDCVAQYNYPFGYRDISMCIVMAEASKVAECSFRKCCCQPDKAVNVTSSSYILSLSQSTEKNNDFNECQSYHYKYGNRLDSHNVGTI